MRGLFEDAEEYFTFVSVRPGGITLASRLLGHASEAGTRANYVATSEQVDPVTAVIRDGAIGRAKA